MASEFAIVERLSTSGERWDLHCAMPPDARSLLDVGCGTGNGFANLRQRGVRVVGVDHDAGVVAEARRVLDDALVLDIETADWPAEFAAAFDVVAFADSLEHLRDPWAVLRSVGGLLTPRGVVVASVPNVRQVRIIAKLALGRWTYVDGPGTMSNSHLRFFTERTVRDLFGIAGYGDVRCHYPRRTFHLRQPERTLNALTGGRLAGLLYNSLTVSGRPAPAGARPAPRRSRSG
ncbi:MAG TPA: class I SAM-dependent methyltransferase [Candidatus Dormibacteraeota bacterium]|nr:class I SAM-dependent methyltransferase [Candidatus Dormibacteraeota bacterium]